VKLLYATLRLLQLPRDFAAGRLLTAQKQRRDCGFAAFSQYVRD
jgi:hypothetical protein